MKRRSLGPDVVGRSRRANDAEAVEVVCEAARRLGIRTYELDLENLGVSAWRVTLLVATVRKAVASL
jgi:histidyl-tRNA synthetase